MSYQSELFKTTMVKPSILTFIMIDIKLKFKHH